MQSNIVHFYVGNNQKQFSIHQALENSFPRKALEPAMIENIDEEVTTILKSLGNDPMKTHTDRPSKYAKSSNKGDTTASNTRL